MPVFFMEQERVSNFECFSFPYFSLEIFAFSVKAFLVRYYILYTLKALALSSFKYVLLCKVGLNYISLIRVCDLPLS